MSTIVMVCSCSFSLFPLMFAITGISIDGSVVV